MSMMGASDREAYEKCISDCRRICEDDMQCIEDCEMDCDARYHPEFFYYDYGEE